MEHDYTCWSERELIERIAQLEKGLKYILYDYQHKKELAPPQKINFITRLLKTQ